jgi:hypothetical protein
MRCFAPALGLLASVAVVSTAWAAQVAPRPVVEGGAKAIADNYFDPAKGAALAGQLRAEAAKGAYDRLTDPRDLAMALSDRLRPEDRHFVVHWAPETAPSASTAGPAPVAAPRPDPFRRANYGVRRIEILGGNLGYIDLRFFADIAFGQPDDPIRKTIDAALQTVVNADAVIIDVRENGGGSSGMVGYLTSAFTPKGADIYNTFKHRDRTESEAPLDWYPAPRLTTPLYILISGRTGSAAEALAYTLKNAGRAVIVGEPSAGAANPGGPVKVGGGFSIFVSDGTPISPITKTNWEGAGVQPDVPIAADKALTKARELALEAVLKTATGSIAREATWALEAIRAEANPPATKPLTDYAGPYGAIEVVQADGRIALKRGTRPLTLLQPLGGDAFTVVGDPSRRMLFERDAQGTVTAFEAMGVEGPAQRFRRGAAAPAL